MRCSLLAATAASLAAPLAACVGSASGHGARRGIGSSDVVDLLVQNDDPARIAARLRDRLLEG